MTRPIHDISIAFAPGTPEWPGDTPCSCGWSWAIAQGASVNVSRMETSPHVGTHADAPLHVGLDAPGANQLPLDAFIGLSRVIDVRHLDGEITMGQLEAAGLSVSARTPSEALTEIVELPQSGRLAHPWFLAVQFHPEFTSTPREGHPLFISYVRAAIEQSERTRTAQAA